MQHMHDHGTVHAAPLRRDALARAGAPAEATAPEAVAWRRATRDPQVAALLALVAAHAGIAPQLLVHGSRCRSEVAAARQLAMYLMNVILCRTYTQIGLVFGRDRTTVRHACAVVEDRREEPSFDEAVCRLEAAIGGAEDEADAEAAEASHAAL